MQICTLVFITFFREERESFIKRKYEAKEFIDTTIEISTDDFKNSILENNILKMLYYIARGIDKTDFPYIAFAIKANLIEATTMLLYNGFDPDMYFSFSYFLTFNKGNWIQFHLFIFAPQRLTIL